MQPENKFDKLYRSIFEELQNPEVIEWFPTYLCNSRCQYCGGYDKEAISNFGKIISNDEIAEIIKISGQSGTAIWNIGGRGGEPLLYPDLISILESIKRHKMTGILITNGLLLDKPFITRLINANWDILRISLDSNIPEIHDEIRGINGNFGRIDSVLSLFKKIKEERNLDLPYIISCPVVNNKNYKYIPEYIAYCIEKGINEIQFMPLINVHEKAQRLALSNDQRDELTVLLENIICENRIKHNISFIISLYKNNNVSKEQRPNLETSSGHKLFCIHLWKTLVISEDGYISPCSLIKDKLFKIKGSFLRAWDSKIMNELREKVLNGQIINPVCQDCCGPLRQETENFNRQLMQESKERR